MADDNTAEAQAPATTDNEAAFAKAMAAFSAAEKSLLALVAAVADLVHPEASGLRGLAATVLSELRAGKPGGNDQ